MTPPAPATHHRAIIGDDAPPVAASKEGDLGARVKPVRPVREYWKNDQANRSCARGDYCITGHRGIMDEACYI